MVNKSELINLIAKKTGFPVKNVAIIFNITFHEIRSNILEGNEISIHSFGKFKNKHKSAYLGRNPKTGEPVEVKAKNILLFKPSKKFFEL